MKFSKSRLSVLVVAAAILAIALPATRDVTAQGQSALTVEVRKLPDMEPMPEFAVQLLSVPAEGVDAAPGVAATLSTDGEGNVVFPGLAAGQYQAVGIGAVPDSCAILPSPTTNLDGTAANTVQVLIECGDSGLWQLLLLAPLGITSSDPTPTSDPLPPPPAPDTP